MCVCVCAVSTIVQQLACIWGSKRNYKRVSILKNNLILFHEHNILMPEISNTSIYDSMCGKENETIDIEK